MTLLILLVAIKLLAQLNILKDGIILFFRQKMKDDLSQKIHGNMMFSVYSVKTVFRFPTNMILPYCQKNKDDLLPKKDT